MMYLRGKSRFAKVMAKYGCKPHYKFHDGCWRVHFNYHACSIRSEVPRLRSILTTFPEVVIDYHILLEDQQRFIP